MYYIGNEWVVGDGKFPETIWHASSTLVGSIQRKENHHEPNALQDRLRQPPGG